MSSLERVDQALAWAREALAGVPGSEPLDARVLLAHVLQVDRATLIAHPERPLALEQAIAYEVLVDQRVTGVPVAYLTGECAFFDRGFTVTPDVMIPRPETEHLIEAALAWAKGRDNLRIVDVGTGSGVIAIILAAHVPDARVTATDVSAVALAVARRNAARYDLTQRIRFRRGNLLLPLLERHRRVDLIAANLPYIPSGQLAHLALAQHEPHLALDGGEDGLALVWRLLGQAPDVLDTGGLLLLEIGAGQSAQVCQMAASAFPDAQVRALKDYAGHDRIVRIERSG